MLLSRLEINVTFCINHIDCYVFKHNMISMDLYFVGYIVQFVIKFTCRISSMFTSKPIAESYQIKHNKHAFLYIPFIFACVWWIFKHEYLVHVPLKD